MRDTRTIHTVVENFYLNFQVIIQGNCLQERCPLSLLRAISNSAAPQHIQNKHWKRKRVEKNLEICLPKDKKYCCKVLPSLYENISLHYSDSSEMLAEASYLTFRKMLFHQKSICWDYVNIGKTI